MTTTKHTAEPWHYGEDNSRPNGLQPIYSEDGWLVADAAGAWKRTPVEREANAHRIVACVNACKGMEDPAETISTIKAVLLNTRTVLRKHDSKDNAWALSHIDDAIRALGG